MLCIITHRCSTTTQSFEEAMEYSLVDAAKAARVNKSTVLRAIGRGKLSARREEDGSYRIDASELARVYELRWLGVSEQLSGCC